VLSKGNSAMHRNVSTTDKSLHIEYGDEDRAWWVDLCHHKFRVIHRIYGPEAKAKYDSEGANRAYARIH
jgi:hypothetical protein